MRKVLKYSLLVILLVFIAPVLAHAALWISEDRPRSWRDADWSSAKTLPDPHDEPEASVRILAARAGGLKGAVSVHTWLVLKPAGGRPYDRYEVVGWGSPLRRNGYPADGRWYSNDPVVIYELKGEAAERLLPKVEQAIRAYQFSERGSYRIWPGPNSNTFVASVLAAVPELAVTMPPTAVGRDFPAGSWLRRLPGGGFSASLGGFAGVTIGLRQGVEVNLLGLVAGVRFRDPALILPGFGALGQRF